MTVSLQRLKRMLGIIIFIMMISPSLVQAIDLNDTVQPSLSDTALPDLFSGTMNFQIPIEVPPGINGLQPALTLFYRSSNGNGWLGQGWEMEAGALERSTKTGAVDYTADNYLFRNTGTTSELVPVGNGEFRRKVESDFLRFETSYCIYDICKIGDPSYLQFKATNKLGIKYYFGATGTALAGDSGARIMGASGTFRWALGRVQDTFGNEITYIYQVDNGQIYLSQIHYNGNTIMFALEDRTDVLASTLPGFTVTTGKRLKQIDVRSKDGNLMNKYVLNYDANPRSRLRSVQKFGRDGATADLSQTFTFDYTYFNSIGDVLTFIKNGYGAAANISYVQPLSASYVGTPPNPIPLAVECVDKR